MIGRHRLRYLRAAQRDLFDILNYVIRDDPRAARNLVDRLEQAIGRLAFYPNSGRAPFDRRLRRLGYRVLVVDDYLVFHVVRPRTVFVHRVIHGARRYAFLMRRR